MEIEYIENIPKQLEDKLSQGHEEYEKENKITINYKPFAFVLKDNNKNIIGGLTGYTAFEEIYIDELWIDKSYRRQGYAKRLLEKVEKTFGNQGYDNINLVTNEFQSPEFYKKCGFEIEFIRKSRKNSKLNKYFFIKRL